ncbi:MAG: phage capsid protein [Candidatus Omnitrophota bacterium]|jgi:hypothetical protein
MPSSTYSPSIDQAAKLIFQDNFMELAQQTKSLLGGSKVVTYLPSKGKTNNLARIGRIELEEVSTRNPDKSYGDYSVDNRQLTKRRFTKTITIDAKYDINELLKDPSSDILKQLVNAKERVIDRVIASAAQGVVLVGAPDAAPTSISAATDGVLTVAGTAGISSTILNGVIQKFINNDLPYDLIRGSVLCITGKENSALMADDKFINSLYMDAKPIADGKISKAGLFEVALFAGSESGLVVPSPVLDETVSSGTVRNCLALAPESVAVAMEIGDLSVERNPNKVNSQDITIDLWINAMRTEGARVIIVTTTI